MCVCVRKTERERKRISERQNARERERKKERKGENVARKAFYQICESYKFSKTKNKKVMVSK